MIRHDKSLVFRICAALGSMGSAPGNELRSSDRWPARSAILGLIGAALGVDRSDREGQEALEHGYRVALARPEDSPGSLLTDFQTTLTIPKSASSSPPTRAQALEDADSHKVNPVLSWREYYENCLFDVAIVSSREAQWSLIEIADALRAPTYVLYFGRKACPLTAPTHPAIFDNLGIPEAIRHYAAERETALPEHHYSPQAVSILADAGLIESSQGGYRLLSRRDGIIDRQLWLFSERNVELYDNAETLHE